MSYARVIVLTLYDGRHREKIICLRRVQGLEHFLTQLRHMTLCVTISFFIYMHLI